MSKNVIIFCDGTGQEGGKGNSTNIYKLFNMIEDRTPRQVAFYDRGLGTGWRKITGNISGMGISRNIRECYTFIFENFEAGDRIFLFGFSRGAATVRSLSSFIHHFGILPKSRPELIKKAYRIYKIRNKDKRKKKADDLVRRHHTMWTRIKVLGCFDTVAALGLPFKLISTLINLIPFFRHKFHDFKLSESVENAYHALAIDDERKTFHPVLWDADVKDGQSVHQVWFAGMHTDVGGGYKEQNISDISLVWMTDMAVKKGLLIYPNNKVSIEEDANGFMHDSRGRMLTKLFRRKVRFWPRDESGKPRKDKPVVHQSVVERSENEQKKGGVPYNPWILELDYETEPWVQKKDQNWARKPEKETE